MHENQRQAEVCGSISINPLQVRGEFHTRIHKTKTDKLDAHSISRLVLSNKAHAAGVPDKQVFALRFRVRHRERHVTVINERHLVRLLAESIERYYHTDRPHQELDGETPVPHAKPPECTGATNLVATLVLGGLHHTYRRVSA